jgi:hypothetical protein
VTRLGGCAIWLAISALIVLNAVACRRFCGDEATHGSRWPFLTDDHSLHYGNALSTRTFFQESASNAGYNPFFMAGYAKSSVWPPNPQLELAVVLTSSFDSAKVFKAYVWLSATAIPLALLYVGWRFHVSSGVVLGAIVFWLLQYWAGFPFHSFHYVQFGMAAFVWSVALTLVAGAALHHWIQARTWLAALEMGLSAAVAFMAHATVAVLLGVPAIVAFAYHRSLHTWRAFGQALFAVALVVGLNYWWVAPLVLLRNTWGGAPEFFKNPNVLERLFDLVRFDRLEGIVVQVCGFSLPVPYLIGPPLVGALTILSLGGLRRVGSVAVLTLTWVFVLSFPGGLLESTAFLQFGRDTIHLMAWVCLPAAAAVAVVWRRWRPLPKAATLLVVGWCVACGVVRPAKNLSDVFRRGFQATTAILPAHHVAVVKELHRRSPTARRILFEVFEGRDGIDPAVRAAGVAAFGDVRLAPLIPHETGLEVVGGPYLSTHYKTNVTNCGDGAFIGGKPWNRRNVEDDVRAYAIDLAVLWSPPALAFANENADLLEPLKEAGGIHLFRVRRQQAAWESAGLRISATYNQIIVENANGARGTFVLPYHASQGWSVEPVCRLTSTVHGDDPVPLLTLIDPPVKATLRFSPWNRFLPASE